MNAEFAGTSTYAYVTYDEITFVFEKLDNGKLRFARTELDEANPDLADTYDRETIPQSVYDKLTEYGYEHA